MTIKRFTALFIMLMTLFLVPAAAAQDEGELKLRLSRDFGYSSGTGKIQGTFSMKASGPDDLARVEFYIDEEQIGEVAQSPFRLRFVTDNYELGVHSMYAIGYTADGRELRSNTIKAEYVSAGEGWDAALKIVGPILGIAFAVIVLSSLSMIVSGRKTKDLAPGTPRNYGAAGGAICPRCGRPYPRHILAPNMLVGKLERCPFCGKWAIVAARSQAELHAAEAAELEDARQEGEAPVESEEAKLRKELDDSRYQDM